MASREFMIGITGSGHLGNVDEYAFVLLHVERSQSFTNGLPFNAKDGLDEKAKDVLKGVLVFTTDTVHAGLGWMEGFQHRLQKLTKEIKQTYQVKLNMIITISFGRLARHL